LAVRLVIAAVGRMREGPERLLLARYRDRLGAAGRALGWGPLEIVEVAESRSPDAGARRSDEAARLLARIGDCQTRITLDEKGRQLTSAGFARYLRERQEAGTRATGFLIGGPDGHGPEALAAGTTLSLGALTLPHMLARIVLVEQLYRAATILTGHPYHRG
jgi:23S rRNA (pseudouridine1915-N3)-methyltransferase